MFHCGFVNFRFTFLFNFCTDYAQIMFIISSRTGLLSCLIGLLKHLTFENNLQHPETCFWTEAAVGQAVGGRGRRAGGGQAHQGGGVL